MAHMHKAFFWIPVTRLLLLSTADRLLAASSSTAAFLHLPQHRYRTTFLVARRKTKSYLKLTTMSGTKFESPSAERNQDPIWQVLNEKVIPTIQEQTCPKILEIAAGAGVHTQYFAKQLLMKLGGTTSSKKTFAWFPTDTDQLCLSSIASYVADDQELVESEVVQTPNILTLYEDGIVESEMNQLLFMKFDLITNINMIHISPWTATIGLMKIAGEKLQSHTGILFLYGPYKVNGTCCESNRSFDLSLRQRNEDWGVRDLEMVKKEAELNGLTFIEAIEMPANNLSILFRKQ